MSHYMTALAMRQKNLKPAAKIVLYWLADHHNESTGACFPSFSTLAEECEMDRATVIRHINSLCEMGLVKRIERNRENGSRSSNGYSLSLKNNPSQNATTPVANCDPHNLGNITNKKTNNKLLVKKGCRWTEDSTVEQDWIDWAIEQGLSEEAARLEADKFSDYWIATTGTKATKLNWFATWRNWIRNAQKRTGARKVVNIFDDPKYFQGVN